MKLFSQIKHEHDKDQHIDFLDVLIRYNFNYNVQFNSLDIDEEEDALNNGAPQSEI